MSSRKLEPRLPLIHSGEPHVVIPIPCCERPASALPLFTITATYFLEDMRQSQTTISSKTCAARCAKPGLTSVLQPTATPIALELSTPTAPSSSPTTSSPCCSTTWLSHADGRTALASQSRLQI